MAHSQRLTQARLAMVEDQIVARGVSDPRVHEAMRSVPRHAFVEDNLARLAYRDHPLPIGHDQTISQPYIVAYMSAALGAAPGDKVLEVGTGSGYQAAVLAAMGVRVHTVEVVEPLGRRARETLERLGHRVRTRIGDGHEGWPEAAPFDGIIVTAAPEEVPPRLVAQLRQGGRLVIPVGRGVQELRVYTKASGAPVLEATLPVRFVPMVGHPRRPRCVERILARALGDKL
jgi:protein-L-isoaspartate(D-aspartate) O-methyltransferase